MKSPKDNYCFKQHVKRVQSKLGWILKILLALFGGFGYSFISYSNSTIPLDQLKIQAQINLDQLKIQAQINQMQEALDVQREWVKERLIEANIKVPINKNKDSDDNGNNEGVDKVKTILLVSTWRSGSSFLGGLFESHPGMMYVYEPFQDAGDEMVRDVEATTSRIDKFVKCDYDGLGDYLENEKENMIGLPRNQQLWRWCTKGYFSCWHPSFLTQFCRLFPFMTLKTVRLPLASSSPLLSSSLVTKVLLLVRDPRGTMMSRAQLGWCRHPDCVQPERLCANLVDDYNAATRLIEKYPGQVAAVRYEDLSDDPLSATQLILEWAGLKVTNGVKRYIKGHSRGHSYEKSVYSTYRNSQIAKDNWKKIADWKNISIIQEVCSDAMRVWGYLPAKDQDHMKRMTTIKLLKSLLILPKTNKTL